MTQELGDGGAVFPARYVFASFPGGEGAFIYAEEFLAFVRWHFQVEPVLLDTFADILGIRWIVACFP
jgi:hypothetical protein